MTQPEALRLADALDDEFTQGRISNHNGRKAAAELRRLHAENEDLTAANEQFGKRQEWWNEKMFVLEAQRDALLEFVKEVRRSGDTRLASMAIAIIAKAEGQQ